jgi:hypothetical protein
MIYRMVSATSIGTAPSNRGLLCLDFKRLTLPPETRFTGPSVIADLDLLIVGVQQHPYHLTITSLQDRQCRLTLLKHHQVTIDRKISR